MKYYAVAMDGVFERVVLELDEHLEPEEEADQLPSGLGSSADFPVECTSVGIFDSKIPIVTIGHHDYFQAVHAESEIEETKAELKNAKDPKAIEMLNGRIEFFENEIKTAVEARSTRDFSGREEPPAGRTYWIVELKGERLVDYVIIEGDRFIKALEAYHYSKASAVGTFTTSYGKIDGNPLDAHGILFTAECMRALATE